uniref:EF-hand domain-containing protein n=1 Tax=Aquila chrysaetos chrysaetos TaxID=223781 RepID=A0A663DSM3_AQUCH
LPLLQGSASTLLQALVKEANAHGEKLSGLEAVASRLKDFSRKQDGAVIQNLVLTARERLSKVLQRTSERGAALEEARKRTKQFTDALQALMDWLYRAEPQLSEDVPVGGDRDLVGDLMDKHKVGVPSPTLAPGEPWAPHQPFLEAVLGHPVYPIAARGPGVHGSPVFQKELGKRASCIKMLKRSVRDLTRGSSSVDSQWLQKQMEELSTRWDLVCKLSVSKQARLEAALRQAEEFHTLVHSFLGRLSESEKALKYGVFPEEELSLQCQQLELECITSLGEEILSTCHPDSVITIKSWVTVAKSRFQEVLSWAQQQGERLQAQTASLAAEREEMAQLIDWITAAEEALSLRDQEPLPEEAEQLEELNAQHTVRDPAPSSPPRLDPTEDFWTHQAEAVGAARAQGAPAVPLGGLEPQTPLMAQLLHRWQQLWLLALDRQYRLETALQRLRELEEFAHFDFGVWRKRYMQWISQMKSRVLDVFRGIDRDQDGRISQREFIESVLSSKFPTNVLEMNAVASIFDMNGDGFIDYYEFVSTLHPNRDPLRRTADADQIQDEVRRGEPRCLGPGTVGGPAVGLS